MLSQTSTPAEIFIPFFDAERLHDYLRLAAEIRAAGWGVEVYPEPKKLGQQLKYADKRGFAAALIMGENEFVASECQLKNLKTTQSTTVSLKGGAAGLVAELRTMLGKSAATS